MSIEEERINADGRTPFWVIEEHQARYRFATSYTTGRVVVDCACGDGTGLVQFGAVARRAVGLDLSPTAISIAAKTCAHLGHVVCVRADAAAFPIASGSADLVISLETIEHLDDDVPFLAEVRRVLRPDGVLICSTPNRAVTHPGAPLAVRPMNRFHTREYTVDEYRNRLGDGFGTVEMYGQNPQGNWRTRTFAALGSVLPLLTVARLNQLTKIRRFLRYSPSTAVPRRLSEGDRVDYEYIIAVCQYPRRSDPTVPRRVRTTSNDTTTCSDLGTTNLCSMARGGGRERRD